MIPFSSIASNFLKTPFTRFSGNRHC